ncbi:hypothetical protein [Paenibacillus abyssi]|uniref:VOC domain-containing protein n=1 Tax=Paenibacillus abyssi TaxID=1340531 RepID=A0A917CTT5_9BACL|nr:hypothetical protein [Paenibacillus abyssi]GGF97536.1 hypothetical protein GCM10010916_13460 [Paenibacillus abyssi]
MKIKGIERVALQVQDIEVSVERFSRLLGTSFQRHDLQIGEAVTKLAFSPLGIELLEDPSSEQEFLRSFHLRVENIDEVRRSVKEAGGQVLSQICVGSMEHVITQFGAFRIVFVCYSGQEALQALAGSDI